MIAEPSSRTKFEKFKTLISGSKRASIITQFKHSEDFGGLLQGARRSQL